MHVAAGVLHPGVSARQVLALGSLHDGVAIRVDGHGGPSRRPTSGRITRDDRALRHLRWIGQSRGLVVVEDLPVVDGPGGSVVSQVADDVHLRRFTGSHLVCALGLGSRQGPRCGCRCRRGHAGDGEVRTRRHFLPVSEGVPVAVTGRSRGARRRGNLQRVGAAHGLAAVGVCVAVAVAGNVHRLSDLEVAVAVQVLPVAVAVVVAVDHRLTLLPT